MTTYSPAVQQLLDGFLATPTSFVGHGIAQEVQSLPPLDAMYLLLTMLDEDPPQTIEFRIAQVLLATVIAEAVRS